MMPFNIKHFISSPASKEVAALLQKMVPVLENQADFVIHGDDEDDSKVVSKFVTKKQLEEFKERAKAMLASVK